MQKWCNTKTVVEKSIGQLWCSHKINLLGAAAFGEEAPPPYRTVIEGSPVVDPEGGGGGGGGFSSPSHCKFCEA